jgi:two-component system sensor histidine kinase AlgZ
MPKRSAVQLPDFRNLGVLLRTAVAVQLLALAAAVILSPDLAGVGATFLGMAAVLQPPLLLVLLLAFFGAPWLLRQPYKLGVAVIVVLSALVTVLWHMVLHLRFPDTEQGSVLRAVLLAAGTALAVLAYFNWRHRVLSPALAEARLQALQSRIRPHFLYNSLNTVLSLMRNSPRQAEEVLVNLADLFRVHMADNRQLSPLSRELELARAYAGLEQIRLGERLKLAWKVDNAPDDALLPPLVLQPLLENAIYHGVEGNPSGGEVRVDVFARDNALNLVLRNPVQSTGERRSGNRMALSNIRERLALHFDADARLTTHEVGGEFIVQVVMPLRRGQVDAAAT